MKKLFSFPVLAIVTMIFIVGCSKDKDSKSDFDPANPVGWVILSSNSVVYEFASATKVNYITPHIPDEFAYTVEGNRITLTGANEYFIINGNDVQLFSNNVQRPGTYRLVKRAETSQLAGKTFKGVYKKSDGSVLHAAFFYSFYQNANKVDAGYTVGTALRTENYTSISNVAGRVEHFQSPEYYELFQLIDGKLYVTYSDNSSNAYSILDPM